MNREIKEALTQLAAEYDDLCIKLSTRAAQIVGDRKVRIVSNWNGQPYGCSRPSRKGRVFDIEHISLGHPVAVYIKDFPYDDPPLLKEVEFVEEQQ